MKETIFIIDDDLNICELVKMYLEDEYIVVIAHDGIDILERINKIHPSLLILDIMLPEKNGLEICKEIRQNHDIPIIMLTAKGEEIDKVLGLELGADDYITKPFSPREMSARVKAVLRRTRNLSKTKSILKFKGITIDADSRQATVSGELVDLTPKEYEMLFLLASNPGKVFTRNRLLDEVWGYDYFGDTRTVDSQIKRLRKKIESYPGVPSYIQTVWGIGYKFEENI